MALTPGTRIGSYEIAAQIGVGGMGEVYRATDTNLDRQVAIKVLPEAVAADVERLARFDREAKTLAALNHPNIAAIYGLERSSGQTALVMELVEGSTLADGIAQGRMPVDEVLPIARQIAEALEAAHERGIVHRDLKPANVKVRPDGTVKVLDFGLAKALEGSRADANATHSPTLSLAATQQGLILGTAAYMSPEQARGQAVDRRTDVWAFGCVLLEMLTGKPAFPGNDVTDILAAVVRAEPDWSGLPADVGPRLGELIARCLRKDVRQRKQSIGDVRADLELASGSADVPAADAETATAPGGRRTIAWGAALFALGVVLAAIVTSALMGSIPAEPRTVRYTFDLSSPVGELVQGSLAISPDGSTLAYVADAAGQTDGGMRGQLYLRGVGNLEGLPVPGATGAASLFFSPDGTQVGFLSSGKLRRAPVDGGTPFDISSTFQVIGVSWGLGDQIVFGGGIGFGLMRVPVEGGETRVLTEPDPARGETHHGLPEVLPDGDTVIFTIGTGSGSKLAKVSIATGEVAELLPAGAGARFVDPGYLVFSENGNLRLAPFDPKAAAITGPVEPALDGVQWRGWAGLEIADFAASRTGDLVFVPGGPLVPDMRMVWVDRLDESEGLGPDAVPVNGPRLSPDGRRVAFMRYRERGIGSIWVMNADGTQAVPIANEGADYNALWRPDGRTVTYTSNGDIFERTVDQEREREQLLDREGYLFPQSWSKDGVLAFMEFSPAGARLWVRPPDGEPQPVVEGSFNSGAGRFSPVNDLLAYVTDQSGQYEVYVRRYPGEERGIRVSSGGGAEPVWSRDGRDLFYRQGDRMMRVRVTTEPELSPSAPELLWEHHYYAQSALWPNYDVAPDGRFLMLEPVTAGAIRVNVFLGWLADVEGRIRGE